MFQHDGAIIVAYRNAVEPITGEQLPTAVPDRVFDEAMTITLGGETVRLFRIAPSHSNSLILVYSPRHQALQCTDFCQSNPFPYNDFLGFYYDGWIETLDWILAQDVQIIDVGHHSPARKEPVRQLREYLVDLHDQVLQLVRQGQHWDQPYRLRPSVGPGTGPFFELRSPTMKVLIVYYSTYGNVYKMTTPVAEGVKEVAGAEPVMRTVPELIPQHVIESRAEMQAGKELQKGVPLVTTDDFREAGAIAFGTPTRFGNVSAQLKN